MRQEAIAEATGSAADEAWPPAGVAALCAGRNCPELGLETGFCAECELDAIEICRSEWRTLDGLAFASAQRYREVFRGAITLNNARMLKLAVLAECRDFAREGVADGPANRARRAGLIGGLPRQYMGVAPAREPLTAAIGVARMVLAGVALVVLGVLIGVAL